MTKDMKCSNCGEEIAEDSLFCEFCGAKVAQKRRSGSFGLLRKRGWWVLIIIPVVILSLFYFYIDNPGRYGVRLNGTLCLRGAYLYFYTNVVDYADKSLQGLGLSYSFVDISICDNEIGAWQTSSCHFSPIQHGGQHVIEVFALECSTKFLPIFIPGHEYTAEIIGLHNGYLFHRAVRYRYVFRYPSSAPIFKESDETEVKLEILEYYQKIAAH